MLDSVFAAVLLLAALLASVAGMGWLALSMQVHAQQVWGRSPTLAAVRLLRGLGMLGLAADLGLCFLVDHASMAALVWIMALVAAALSVAFTLAWRARWLRVLAPWLRRTMRSH